MYNSIPKKPRFNCAEEKARQVLLYYKVNTLPIDVRKLIKASNICVIKCYSKLIKRHSLKKEDLYESFGKDGAVYMMQLSLSLIQSSIMTLINLLCVSLGL